MEVGFHFTKGQIKIEMISKATEDARIRAEKIAAYSNGELGALQSTKMGFFKLQVKILLKITPGEAPLIPAPETKPPPLL